jgi:hypothetical protein
MEDRPEARSRRDPMTGAGKIGFIAPDILLI